MKPQVSFEQLEAIVRNRVCAVCDEKTADSICGLEEPDYCSLFRLFPRVVESILATESDRIEPYLDALHEHVCSVCVDQRLDGACPRRGVACSLDAYLPSVVDAIEEAIGRKFERKDVN